MIRVVVFDFDGTLVNSNAIKREGFFHLAAHYPGGAATMAALIGTAGNRHSILSAFADRMAAVVRLEVDELVASYGIHVDTAVAAAAEMHGASDLLANLWHEDLRLHLSSATPAASLLAILEKRGWTTLFKGIHGAPKSKIETLYKICEAENASGKEIAVVGDGIDDARAAELVGAQFIAVGSGSYAAAHPDLPIRPLHDVVAQLRTLD